MQSFGLGGKVNVFRKLVLDIVGVRLVLPHCGGLKCAIFIYIFFVSSVNRCNLFSLSKFGLALLFALTNRM